MKRIEDKSFDNKRALIRVDFNVPLEKQSDSSLKITDDTRIQATLPTIKYVLENNGSVVLMSHLGRPKEGYEKDLSLVHLCDHLEGLLGTSVIFGGDCISDEAFELTKDLPAGEVVLLDNLRFHKEETNGDKLFAEKLSKHGDIYVNDAFGTAHRAHASTAIIAEFFQDKKVFGKLLASEIESVDKVLHHPEKPVTAIVGGAKVSSKIGIIEQLLNSVDHLIIGGGMAYTFIKAQGGEIGSSLVEEDFLSVAKEILAKAVEKNVTINLPVDTIIADEFSEQATTKTSAISRIPDGWMGLDIAAESVKNFKSVIENSKTILWNGPMGVFEMEKFSQGTIAIAQSIAAATKKGAFSLIGGGDSVAAINKFNLSDQVSYVSTGGGAMLEYLEGKTLPGIAAILN